MGSIPDDVRDELNDLLRLDRDVGAAQWLERAAALIPVGQRVVAAVELAASWWLPVLAEHDAQNAQGVAQLLRTAAELSRNTALPRDLLKHARVTGTGMPPHGPPPPYVGHFCAAVMHLLDAMIDPPNYDELARALSFATVAPDGSVRTKEVTEAVTW